MRRKDREKDLGASDAAGADAAAEDAWPEGGETWRVRYRMLLSRIRSFRHMNTKWYSRYVFIIVAFVYILVTLIAEVALALVVRYLENPGLALLIILIALPASTVVVSVFLMYLSTLNNRNTDTLSDAIIRVSAGDYSVKIEHKPRVAFAEVYDNFNKMVEELESVKTMRDDYVSNFSHEIKTPVASINGFARLLKDGNLTEEERAEIIDIIVKESERLSAISQNSLLLSKLETQRISGEAKEFNLDTQIKECIIMQERTWGAKDISVETDLDPVTYLGDEQLIGQIWVNVISNAVKFTPEGGEISVSLKVKGDRAEVKISDNGCGMSEEDAAHAFEKHYQGAGALAEQGNGLGLPICRRICELVGGDIRIDSRLGEGTTVTVTL